MPKIHQCKVIFYCFSDGKKNLNYKRLKKRTRIYVANYSLALNRKCCVFRLLIIKEKWLFEAEVKQLQLLVHYNRVVQP